MALVDSHCHLLLGVVPELKILGPERHHTALAAELRALWSDAARLSAGGPGSAAEFEALTAAARAAPQVAAYLEGNALRACLTSFLSSPVTHWELYTTSLLDAQLTALVLLTQLTPVARARFSLGLGLHPWYLYPNVLRDELAGLLELAAWLKGAAPELLSLSWGEVGLDRRRAALALPEQQALLRDFIAATRGRHYSWHCVGAYSELQALFKRQPELKGTVHGFAGKIELARALGARGLKLGVGPKLLCPQQEAKWRELLAQPQLCLAWCLESDSEGAVYDGALVPMLKARFDMLRVGR